MSTISLESAIRTCKVDTAYANKIESDRFLNPNLMVCPVWNGMDNTGRIISPDSFYTKRAGCNSASDRVVVENNVSRPQYMEYITLSAGGIAGNIYNTTSGYKNAMLRTKHLDQINDITGTYGNDFGATNKTSCGYYPYNEAMSQEAEYHRKIQSKQNGHEAYRQRAGF